jgi:hypothetical protein
LPNLKDDENFDHRYAIVYDDWDVRVSRGAAGKQLPSLCHILFG